MTLPAILAAPMADYERLMAQQLNTGVALINDITRDLSSRKGKRLRPILTMLSAGATFGSVPEKKILLAVALELLHNSSLIHDDVVDESLLRRNSPTANSTWGNKIAVLYGDFCLANVLQLLCSHASREETAIVNLATIEMTEGELLQQQNSLNNDLSLDTYRSTIYKKTASLLAACCQVGQWRPEPLEVDLRHFGYHFGMAFQMRDDLLDYSPSIQTGKPYGNDLREHKMTLPLILFMQRASEGDKAFVERVLKQEVIDDVEVMQVIAAAERSGAIEATREYVRQELDLALASLAPLPDSPYKEALVQVTESMSY